MNVDSLSSSTVAVASSAVDQDPIPTSSSLSSYSYASVSSPPSHFRASYDNSNSSTSSITISSPPGSPIRSNPNDRIIRRKRSKANAALTSRPSMISLRDARNATTTTTTTIPSQDVLLEGNAFRSLNLGEGDGATSSYPILPVAKVATTNKNSDMMTCCTFDPKVEDCILIQSIKTMDPQSPRLGYALFQPNLLIDSSGTIARVVNRERWEQLRATVEESRILFINSATGQEGEVFSTNWLSCTMSDLVECLPDQAIEVTFHLQQSTSDSHHSSLTSLTVRASDLNSDSDSIPTSAYTSLPSPIKSLLQQSRTVHQTYIPSSTGSGSKLCRNILALTSKP